MCVYVCVYRVCVGVCESMSMCGSTFGMSLAMMRSSTSKSSSTGTPNSNRSLIIFSARSLRMENKFQFNCGFSFCGTKKKGKWTVECSMERATGSSGKMFFFSLIFFTGFPLTICFFKVHCNPSPGCTGCSLNIVFFPSNVVIFLNSASPAAALVFYLPGVCTHNDTEGKQRKARGRNIFKKSEKTIFNEHPVLYV